MHCKFVEMNKAVNVRHPSGNSRAKTVWKERDAKEGGDTYFDQRSTGVVGQTPAAPSTRLG